jgi:hypothetical protein
MFIHLCYFYLLINFNQFIEFNVGLYAFALHYMYLGRICWLIQVNHVHRKDHTVLPFLYISYSHQFPAEELAKP